MESSKFSTICPDIEKQDLNQQSDIKRSSHTILPRFSLINQYPNMKIAPSVKSNIESENSFDRKENFYFYCKLVSVISLIVTFLVLIIVLS